MFRKTITALGAVVITLSAVTMADAQTCPIKAALPNNGGTSGNARCPMPRYRFARSVYLITPAEMAAAGYVTGASPTTIGWNYSANNGGGTAPLIVYMENTTDTTNTKSTTWATAIASMTTVHNDPLTTLPATAGTFDILMTGGSPFTYTGGGLYIAFDWGQYTGTLATTTTALCNTSLINGLLGGQSNTAAPTTLGASSFRPETRLDGANLLNDAGVKHIYSVGALPVCAAPAQTIQAVVTNNGADALTNVLVTLNVTGADTFSDTETIASLDACGGQAVVTFGSYTPSALGTSTITVSLPADSVVGNDSLSRPSDNTQTDYSYKITGSTANGGVGLGVPGAFVAKFTTTVADTITAALLEFNAVTATTYRVAVYSDNAGVPSTTPLYVDAADRTVTAVGPVTITLDSPVAVGPGTFHVGVHQTNATNANYSFDTENPVREDTFFYAAQLPVTTWVDFAPGTNFKLNVGYVGTACIGAPCDADTNGDSTVDVTDLLAVIGQWGACVSPPCSADINDDNVIDVTDLLAVIGAWGACP